MRDECPHANDPNQTATTESRPRHHGEKRTKKPVTPKHRGPRHHKPTEHEITSTDQHLPHFELEPIGHVNSYKERQPIHLALSSAIPHRKEPDRHADTLAQTANHGLISCLVILILLFAASGTNAAVSNKALVLAGTVTGGTSSIEASQALANGLTVDLVDGATWSTMTAADFASYRLIILGDPTCRGDLTGDIGAAITNASTWGPVINGNILITGTDPVFHAGQGGETLTRQSIDFALAQETKTGAYISLSCYFHGTDPGTPVPLLDGIGGGGFTVTGVGCYNDAHIVASHPALAGLSDATLSGWSCSVHEAFHTWPGALIPLAIALDFDSSYTASDGSQGPPYILAGGDIRSFPLSIAPLNASGPAGSQHTVTAELLDGVTHNPVPGARIGFAVTAGPNVGASNTCVPADCSTDANGTVALTYVSNGSEGTDTIQAFYDQNHDGLPTSGEPQTTAGMVWVADGTCNRVIFVGVRGSGEPFTIANLGEIVKSVYETAAALIAGLESYGVPYDARSVFPLDGFPNEWLHGEVLGEQLLRAYLRARIDDCADVSFLLAGYSQGAMVVANVVQGLDAVTASHVLGVGLLGDPEFNPDSTVARGTFNKKLSGFFGTRPEFLAPLLERTVSYCIAGDPVCNFANRNAFRCLIPRLCPHYDYDTYASRKTPYTALTGAFLAQQYEVNKATP